MVSNLCNGEFIILWDTYSPKCIWQHPFPLFSLVSCITYKVDNHGTCDDEKEDGKVNWQTNTPSLIAWHTGRMKLLSWQNWSLEIKDVGSFTSRICNTGRMKLKFQVFVKLVSCQSKRTTQCAPVRNKIIILIYNYWTLITVVHSYLNSLQYTKEQQ